MQPPLQGTACAPFEGQVILSWDWDMATSVFEIFKIGIGPSSSHTVGPMIAAGRFLSKLRSIRNATPTTITCSLHGSLAYTGKGHGTDRAVILGLSGCQPDSVDPEDCKSIEERVHDTRSVSSPGLPVCRFDAEHDLHFDYGPALPGHPNGIRFFAWDASGKEIESATYYSVGGGTVIEEGEGRGVPEPAASRIPFPFNSANEMLQMGRDSDESICGMMLANEGARTSEHALDTGLDRIWFSMSACIDRGLQGKGALPGALKVRRRAGNLHEDLQRDSGRNDIPPHQVTDWLALYAMAVNEENAAGGRIVTAPTNGAAGVIPAVIRYYTEHCPGASKGQWREMLLVAAAVGGVIKQNASISGAEVGCQGEVGSASAMAAAALCSVLGGSNEQIENAAEIALEHHLGMTCDPIGGLVQIPCIERNGLGAVKAVAAASLALRGDGTHYVSLDQCIETMRQTGLDMSDKYKETSRGGLAVNVVAC